MVSYFIYFTWRVPGVYGVRQHRNSCQLYEILVGRENSDTHFQTNTVENFGPIIRIVKYSTSKQWKEGCIDGGNGTNSRGLSTIFAILYHGKACEGSQLLRPEDRGISLVVSSVSSLWDEVSGSLSHPQTRCGLIDPVTPLLGLRICNHYAES